MAFSYFFNMEVLTLDAAKQHIENMTEDNYVEIDEDVRDIRDEVLYNNIKNGFIVITQLHCYIESFLNTIIDRCRGYDESLMSLNIEDKLAILFLEKSDALREIKSHHAYEEYNKARKVRNEMMHFKKALIGEGILFPEFKLAKVRLPEYFLKSNIQEVYRCHTLLCEEIADELGLRIYSDIKAFEVAARDGLISYVFDPLNTAVDESRFI